MGLGRPKAKLVPSVEKHSQLLSFARSRSLPAAISTRARIILCSADGESNAAIAQRFKLSRATVGKLLAEPGRTFLCLDHRQGHPPRLVHQRQATGSAHRSFRGFLQRQLQAVSVDRDGRLDPPKAASTLFTY